ncbi:MAG: uracil-DNA glycosylase [Peptostreptococcaceae bacterium]
MLPKNVHSSWNDFLTDEILNEIKEIESKIGDDFNPYPKEKALRFLSINLYEVKVLIQGMDPYPAENSKVATGRSFEVGNLYSWNDKFRQVSLKNIVRLLYKNYNNIEEYSNIKKFSEIQKEILSGEFKILPPNEIFESWEKQGVLCINIYPTCKKGETGSHKVLWKDFSVKLIEYISNTNPYIRWFLWGSESISSKDYIKKGIIVESRHPMMCSEKYPEDFLKSNCFKDTMNNINWLGK